tara:strand:+ start:28 stop:810 length:783 start_codon:yes stop_codon:yes gene_type:complete
MKNNKILILKKTKNPYFSIITVVKNDDQNIAFTLKSIKHQTFKKFEYLIIDGGSSDKTIEKIFRFKKYINFLISEKDKGIYFAMNKGLKRCKGHVVVFLNSGDILTKNALKIIKSKFKNKNTDFVFGTVKRHYTKDTILKYGFNLNKLKYNFDFATAHSSGFFLKKKIYNQLGFFNTSYKCSADYDLYLKALYKLKIKGDSTSKKELIGIVKSGGFSSSYGFMNHVIEEAKIRINNNQNIFFVGLIFLNALLKKIFKEIS